MPEESIYYFFNYEENNPDSRRRHCHADCHHCDQCCIVSSSWRNAQLGIALIENGLYGSYTIMRKDALVIFLAIITLTGMIVLGASLMPHGGQVQSAYTTNWRGLYTDSEVIMNISSNDFNTGQAIPAKFSCDGKNVAPSLVFSAVPTTAASLAVSVTDMDAPAGEFTHWLVWNIPSATTTITGKLPEGSVEGRNGFGHNGYGGPCPPTGTHNYVFRLYALDSVLSLPAGSDRAAFDSAVASHTLLTTDMTGTYERQ